MGYDKSYFTMLNAAGKFRWYDNEWGYSCRIVDLIEYMIKKGL